MATHSIVSLRSLGCNHFIFCFPGRIVQLLIQTKTKKIERRAKDQAVTKIESHSPERHSEPKLRISFGIFRRKTKVCGSFFFSLLLFRFQFVNFFIENIIIWVKKFPYSTQMIIFSPNRDVHKRHWKCFGRFWYLSPFLLFIWLLYIYVIHWLLAHKSHDISQAETKSKFNKKDNYFPSKWWFFFQKWSFLVIKVDLLSF